jgi:hypothetical protein
MNIPVEELTNLNLKLNSAMAALIVWLLLQAYEAYKKTKDTTASDIIEIKEMLARLDSDLKNRPTYRDLRVLYDDADLKK